jgi:hypothetical protein
MAENEAGSAAGTPEAAAAGGPARTTNEVALELMKFIAVTTGYGRTSQSGTGFSSKPQGRAPEEQIEALLELFDRCRKVVKKED